MAHQDRKVLVWTKPALIKLGMIKDVAGPAGLGTQSNVQNRS